MTSETNGGKDEDEPVAPASVPGYGPPPVVADPGGPEPAVYGIPPQWHPGAEGDEADKADEADPDTSEADPDE